MKVKFIIFERVNGSDLQKASSSLINKALGSCCGDPKTATKFV